jgi:hypothetical protein
VAADQSKREYDLLIDRFHPGCRVDIVMETVTTEALPDVRITTDEQEDGAVRLESVSLATAIARHERRVLVGLVALWMLLIIVFLYKSPAAEER